MVVMNIRIDTETEGADVVLHVAGRFAGDAITLLTGVCEPMEGPYILDLSNLTFVDEAGAEVIQMLRQRGANIRGASSFIKLLINGEHS